MLAARILGLSLLLQAAAYYVVASRAEIVPAIKPLSEFPAAVAGWKIEREYPIEKEVQDVLRADDTLNRVYVNADRTATASLFIAFFKTQRQGQTPHSPKNCLPGAGWMPAEDSKVPVAVGGRTEPIVVNKYVISRGEERSVVLYWYQSHSRVVAGDLSARLWLVADAITSRRSDTALVRVIVPVRDGVEGAESAAREFVQGAFPEIVRQLPQ
jgi:EpsI family protein